MSCHVAAASSEGTEQKVVLHVHIQEPSPEVATVAHAAGQIPSEGLSQGPSQEDLDSAHSAVSRLSDDITALRASYDKSLSAAVDRCVQLEKRTGAAEAEARATVEKERAAAEAAKGSIETLETKVRGHTSFTPHRTNKAHRPLPPNFTQRRTSLQPAQLRGLRMS